MNASLKRVVKAIEEGLGLELGGDIWTPDQLADRVELAARCFAAGRRKAEAEDAELNGAYSEDVDW